MTAIQPAATDTVRNRSGNKSPHPLTGRGSSPLAVRLEERLSQQPAELRRHLDRAEERRVLTGARRPRQSQRRLGAKEVGCAVRDLRDRIKR